MKIPSNLSRSFRFVVFLLTLLSLIGALVVWSGHKRSTNTFLRDIKGFWLLSAFSERGAHFIGSSPGKYSGNLYSHFPDQDKLPANQVAETGAVASLTIDDSDLFGPSHGLLPNATKKGLAWERPGLFTFYREGKILFQSRVGVRIHGGEEARRNHPDMLAFRLYFRPEFGSARVPTSTVWPNVPGWLGTLILLKSTNNLRNAMSLEISRHAGALSPQTEIARFFVNGKNWHRRFSLLTEHINDDFLENHYGHSDFVFHRYKNDDTKYAPGPYADLLRRLKDKQRPLTFAEVEEIVDVKALFAQYTTNMLIKLYDSFQGGILLNKRSADAKWTFVSWDMEGGFWTSWGCQMINDQCPATMDDYFQHLGNRWGLIRETIWQRFQNDDHFRRQYAKHVAYLFRHRITDDWIADLTTRYRQIAVSNGLDYDGDHKYGLDSFAASERFMKQQKQEISAVIKRQWGIDISAIPNETVADESPFATADIH